MKFLMGCILFFAFITSCKWNDQRVKKELEANETKKQAYVLGYGLGERIKQSSKELDQKVFLMGLRHSLKGKEPLLTRKALHKRADKQKPKGGQMSAEEGKKFLEANKQKPGVKTTSSGLQYKELKAGTGRSPSATDRVEVHYRGTFINGEEFDSSYKRNESITFPLNGVIKGWTEGVQLMKEGAEYEFYIPPELGYGSSGTPGIPPNSVLVFKVELIKVL
ncbi:MAG: FKBP-type peptidyl-prolyl cis-trans isomerase [Bdellovibrionales bacterium]|nr:FKBP-type peptidyl-prolyl cis-trans isomerase [Bdellovibrionales bacterium]